MAPSAKIDWRREPLCHLMAYISAKYHWHLREQLSQLIALENRIRISGEPWLQGKPLELLNLLIHQLHIHVVREEQVLFPFLGMLEDDASPASMLAPALVPVTEVVRSDGEATWQLLLRLADLLAGAPDDEIVLALRAELRTLKSHLRPHLRFESTTLFPRAVALEEQLRVGGGTSRRAGSHGSEVAAVADKTVPLRLIENRS